MYIAYQILRGSIDDEDKVARISSVYNIFAYPIFIVLIMVLPKIADFSLHPGAGDSVGFSNYDLNDHLRKVFYPAVLGWILTGTWIAQITGRLDLIIKKKEWND
jgi:heme exporter protein C